MRDIPKTPRRNAMLASWSDIEPPVNALAAYARSQTSINWMAQFPAPEMNEERNARLERSVLDLWSVTSLQQDQIKELTHRLAAFEKAERERTSLSARVLMAVEKIAVFVIRVFRKA